MAEHRETGEGTSARTQVGIGKTSRGACEIGVISFKLTPDLRVILIGGSSHVGKSTLARRRE